MTDMLRKLQSAGLLQYTPYYGATLTPRGRAIALKILRRHRLIELFLHRIMGYGWEQVHDEAERMEHAVSDFFVERIDALMNYPSKDPHGEVIPDARGLRESEDYVSLAQADEGRFTIRKVINASPELLTYLNRSRSCQARALPSWRKRRFRVHCGLQIRGKNTPTYVGLEVANCIFVCRVTNGNRRPHGSKRPSMAAAGKKITSRETRQMRTRLDTSIGWKLFHELRGRILPRPSRDRASLQRDLLALLGPD